MSKRTWIRSSLLMLTVVTVGIVPGFPKNNEIIDKINKTLNTKLVNKNVISSIKDAAINEAESNKSNAGLISSETPKGTKLITNHPEYSENFTIVYKPNKAKMGQFKPVKNNANNDISKLWGYTTRRQEIKGNKDD